MRSLQRTIFALTAASGLALSACAVGGGTSGDGDQLILRLALNQAEDHPSYTALDDFAERLE